MYAVDLYDIQCSKCTHAFTIPLCSDVSSDTPLVKVNASLSSESADGLYHFDNASFVVLDPPVEYFYDSFNAINWTIAIACFNSSSGEISDVHMTSVIEEFTPVTSADKQQAMHCTVQAGLNQPTVQLKPGSINAVMNHVRY